MVFDPSQLNAQSVQPIATAASNWLLQIIIMFVALGAAALIAYLIYQKKQYRYKVKLKIWQNQQFVYFEGVARAKTVDGAPFWYIKKLKHLTSVPPAASQYLTLGGTWVAEGYYDRLAGVIWSKDELSREDFANLINKINTDKTGSGITSIDTHYQPMTTTERSLQASQITKALTRKGHDVWAELWKLLPSLLCVAILVIVFLFYKNITDPLATQAQIVQDVSKTNLQMQQQNLRLYQMLTGGKGNGTYIVQELPSDQQYFIPTRPGSNST